MYKWKHGSVTTRKGRDRPGLRGSAIVLSLLGLLWGSSQAWAGLNVPGQYKQWDDHTWYGQDRTIEVCWDAFPTGAPDYTSVLKEALEQWFADDALNCHFKVAYPTSGPNDITFSWRTGDEDNWGETAWNGGSPSIWVDITQNGPTSGWISEAAFHNIAKHEFGHALALDHPDNPAGKFEPIMSGLPWSYDDIKDTKYHLTAGDKAGVYAVNCIPEPASLIIWATTLFIVVACRRRGSRRRV